MELKLLCCQALPGPPQKNVKSRAKKKKRKKKNKDQTFKKIIKKEFSPAAARKSVNHLV